MQALFCRYPNSGGVKHVEMMMVIDIDFLGAFAQSAIKRMKEFDTSNVSDLFEFRAYWYIGGDREEGDVVDLQNDDHVFFKCSGEHFNNTSPEDLAKEFMKSHNKWIKKENARRKKFRELYEENEKKGVMTIANSKWDKKAQQHIFTIWHKGVIREIPVTAEQLLNGDIFWNTMTKKEATELRNTTIADWRGDNWKTKTGKVKEGFNWLSMIARFEKENPHLLPILNEIEITPFDGKKKKEK